MERFSSPDHPVDEFIPSGQLTATINASDVAQPGFAEITVIDQATGVVYPPVAWFFVTANVYASDVAYDSVRNRFYVTVPSGSSRPNAPAESVVAVDAATGNIIASVNAGSMPSLLAISDDASYLYVYLSESSAISRVALDTFNPDIQIPLLPNASLFWMQVLPGSPKSLATAQADVGTSATQALVVYDDATARPNTYPGAPGRFLFTDPATIVGGYGTGVVEAWTVTASGISSSRKRSLVKATQWLTAMVGCSARMALSPICRGRGRLSRSTSAAWGLSCQG
jgi:hypothetical protein